MGDVTQLGTGFEPLRGHNWELPGAPDLVNLSLVSMEMSPKACILTLRVWADKEHPVEVMSNLLLGNDHFDVTLFSANSEEQKPKSVRVHYTTFEATPVDMLDMEQVIQCTGSLQFNGVKYEVLRWDV